tara:strand:- start:104 stop:241 length:138 start_codon:yes stop_codon:yes gene_type:complete
MIFGAAFTNLMKATPAHTVGQKAAGMMVISSDSSRLRASILARGC